MTEKNIAKLIEKELGFTNGWSISEDRYEELCLEIAKQIAKNYKRKERRLLKELQPLKGLIQKGACLSNIAFNYKRNLLLPTDLQKLLEVSQKEWDREKENTFKIRSKIFNH